MPKRGLLVEGGGMRGAHSAGVLAALAEQSDLHFDVICGSSAGSCTVAYWVAGQQHLLTEVWGQHVHGARLIRYAQFLTGGAGLDLNYLIDEVFGKRVPLDVNAIRTSPIDFYIAATHCKTGAAHYFHNKSEPDILAALKAGAAIPIAFPTPVWLHGAPYADGGIAASIPIQKLLSEGCDEIWAVLTRPVGYRKKPGRLPWPYWYYRRYPALAEALHLRHRSYNNSLEQLEALERAGRARVFRPSPSLPLSRFTRSQKRLLAGMAQGLREGHLTARAGTPKINKFNHL